MNPKFFDVKKEKQDAIINAALKVFAENGYRKASTDVIVKEAGISKGLLFHYFISKSGVYEFIYDYSVKYMMLELNNAVNKKETDFFAIQRMIEACKIRVMKNYPYMQQFLTGSKYETHPDALKAIKASDKGIEDAYNAIYKKVDMTRFPEDVDLDKVIRMIGWMSDGYIKDKFMDGTPDPDEMNAEFARYLAMLRSRFYGKTVEEAAPAAEELIGTTETVRDDSVMDSMRETTVSRLMDEKAGELSFEERLELGKKSAYVKEDAAAEEAAPEADEEETAAAAEAVSEAEEEEPVRAAEAGSEAEEEEPVRAEEGVPEIEEEEPVSAAEAVSEAEEEEPVSVAEATPEAEEEEPVRAAEAAPEAEEEEPVSAAEAAPEAEEEESVSTTETAVDEAEDEIEKTEIIQEEVEPVSEEVSEGEREEDREGIAAEHETGETKDSQMHEVTISIEDFSDAFKSYDTYTYGGKGALYMASGAVKSYIPDFKLNQFYETSRLDDFTYGSDQRGGRGIPYDSSDNIQIFVEEDDIGEQDISGNAEGNDDIDLEGLTDKIMSNTEKESAEFDKARELSEMGPAPVLPDFSPDKLRRMSDSVGDEDDENSHIYRPVRF